MENNYLTVSALSKYIKSMFDEDAYLNLVYIKGEISNFKSHTRGHFYFTIKDENSRINAVMFDRSAKNLKFTPSDGMKVLVIGRISVYEATGNYQIYVESMEEDGLGNLYIAYEKLKEKLYKEGLFDKEKKKKIPKIPKRIGIITAPTGAAIKDILTTIKRRYPICETILFPSLVQGNEAASDIVKNIKKASSYDIDTLIIGRGGGSIEDLWPFNEEIVARAIHECNIPIISAVGHEIDFTIADYVADLRAPTPTAAAELAVPEINTIINYLNNSKSRSFMAIDNIIKTNNKIIEKIRNSYCLKKPMAIYEIKEQYLDGLINRINDLIKNITKQKHFILDKLRSNYILNNPSIIYKYKEQKLISLISKIEVLNPLNTISRGYAIVRNNDAIVSSIKQVKNDDIIKINVKDGDIISKIIKVGE